MVTHTNHHGTKRSHRAPATCTRSSSPFPSSRLRCVFSPLPLQDAFEGKEGEIEGGSVWDSIGRSDATMMSGLIHSTDVIYSLETGLTMDL